MATASGIAGAVGVGCLIFGWRLTRRSGQPVGG
jgi:hypothetical protein